jgi:hypothetical protein
MKKITIRQQLLNTELFRMQYSLNGNQLFTHALPTVSPNDEHVSSFHFGFQTDFAGLSGQDRIIKKIAVHMQYMYLSHTLL